MNQQNAEHDVSIKRIGGIAMQVAGPALAMLVVSSIAFFLIEIFYEGPFVGRVKWIFALFCFAAVLVSRISIEEGFERASVFGFLLGVATLLVASRFLQGSLIILAGILTFVWWAAGRLTWDCTFIDETRDASGQGMIDLAIDRVNRFREGTKVPEAAAPPIPDPDLVQGLVPVDKKPTAWDQFVRIFWKRKQPNTPGLWAFYFLLLGLPLFGIGQMMMKMTDEAGHQAAAVHFFFYMLGLLGLLMLCSVLGLHRYLQNNQSSMPGNIARRWIVAGTILALGITGFCFMLPRPTAKYSIGNWLPRLTTNNTSPSDHSFGNDGQQQGENSNQPGGPKSRDDQSSQNQKQENSSSGGNEQKSDQGAAKNTRGGEKGAGKSKDGKTGRGGNKKQNSNSQSGKSKRNDGKQKGKGGDAKEKSKHKSNEGESGEGDPEEQKSKQRKSLEESARKNQKSKREEGKKQGGGSVDKKKSSSGSRSSGSRKGQGSKKQESKSEKKSSTGFGNFLVSLFKILVFLIALVVIAWFAFKHRSQILPWIQSFLAELAEFWNRLWNREKKQKPKSETIAHTPSKPTRRLPGFSNYRNPFATDAAQTWPTERLVQYTFEAFEAWGRDRDCAREPDQTALEFAQSVIAGHPSLQQEATLLATLYSQLAYAKGVSGNVSGTGDAGGKGIISRSATMALAPLWEKLSRLNVPQPAATI